MCPQYSGGNYTDDNNVAYSVNCNQALQGTLLQPPVRFVKRVENNTAGGGNLRGCLAACDSSTHCSGFTFSEAGICMLFETLEMLSFQPGFTAGKKLTTLIASSSSPNGTTAANTTMASSPLCPTFNGRTYNDARGQTYNVTCDEVFTGTLESTATGQTTRLGTSQDIRQVLAKLRGDPDISKRQGSTSDSMNACFEACEIEANCKGVVFAQIGECIVYTAITGTMPAIGYTAALRIADLPVATITVTTTLCPARYGTTTVFQTATMICDQGCTASGAMHMRANESLWNGTAMMYGA